MAELSGLLHFSLTFAMHLIDDQTSTCVVQLLNRRKSSAFQRVMNDMIYGICVVAGCQDAKLDVVFIMDSSGSISDRPGKMNNWYDIIQFVSRIIQGLDISQADTRIGFVSYSNSAEKFLNLTDGDDRGTVNSALQRVQSRYKGGMTNINDGVVKARELFQSKPTSRRFYPNVAVLIGDGESNVDENLQDATIKAAKEQDRVHFITVGITDQLTYNTISVIASDASDIIQVDNFSQLPQQADNVRRRICCRREVGFTTVKPDVPDLPSMCMIDKLFSCLKIVAEKLIHQLV